MRQREQFQAVVRVLQDQKLLDLDQSLQTVVDRLHKQSGVTDPLDLVAEYTFAWEKYVYHVGALGDLTEVSRRNSAISAKASAELLNLDSRMMEVVSLAVDSDMDEVAGYIYTEDKFTFIVGQEDIAGPVMVR